ncbi:hypothetical protein, partial [Bacillus mycoides]|uniref:hypothetical protein n=1 Tax=Bacillus mycoides TaxID=1405 RepID=UPI003A7FCD9C
RAKSPMIRGYKQVVVLEDVLKMMSDIENSEKSEVAKVVKLQSEANELVNAVIAYTKIGEDEKRDEYLNKVAVVAAKAKWLAGEVKSKSALSGIATLNSLIDMLVNAVTMPVNEFQDLVDKKYRELYGKSEEVNLLAKHLVELSAHARMLAAHGNDEESKIGNRVKELAAELAEANGITSGEFIDLAVTRYLEYNEEYKGQL